MAANAEAFVFVAEFEIRQLGTNADVKYKSSLFISIAQFITSGWDRVFIPSLEG